MHPWEPTITADQIAECHDAGLLVNGWTCNDPARFRELASWGIDGLCTDVPDVMLAALVRALSHRVSGAGRRIGTRMLELGG